MVNVFNENNKLIKESNKQQKSEKEMADLITKNNEIQEDCRKIEDRIEAAKEFSAEIDEVLDGILQNEDARPMVRIRRNGFGY